MMKLQQKIVVNYEFGSNSRVFEIDNYIYHKYIVLLLVLLCIIFVVVFVESRCFIGLFIFCDEIPQQQQQKSRTIKNFFDRMR